MQVNFFATYRQVVGGKTVEMAVPERLTVRQLIDAVIARYPKLRREMLDDAGHLYPHVHVFVNGRDAPYLEAGLDTYLSPADVVNIFPPVAGGDDDHAPDTRHEATLTGIPLWLLREYVEALGAGLRLDGWLHAEGWRARLTQVDDYEIGSLRVGRVRLELHGRADVVDKVRRDLEPKLMRAGG